MAARLGDTSLAERYFDQSAAIDTKDAMGNSALGVHIAALGGLWQVAVLGFAGMALRDDGLAFEPRLPDSWPVLRFPCAVAGKTAAGYDPERATAVHRFTRAGRASERISEWSRAPTL